MHNETDDDWATPLIEDPLLIESREQGMEVIAVLDAEISNIMAQIEVAQVEAAVTPLSDERMGWLRRAAYAKAMRIQEKDRVYRRCKHLRYFKGPAEQERTTGAGEAKRIKQERLMIEAQTRRDAQFLKVTAVRNEQEKLAQKRREWKAQQSIQPRFIDAARCALPEETFNEIMAAANKRAADPA